jgi:hypothetical protein
VVNLPRRARIESDIGAAEEARTIHQPHRGLASVVLPENETLVDAAMLRDWIVNVSRRPAPQRMAHLLSEMRAGSTPSAFRRTTHTICRKSRPTLRMRSG